MQNIHDIDNQGHLPWSSIAGSRMQILARKGTAKNTITITNGFDLLNFLVDKSF